jgi:hypothetical protein
MTPDSLESQHTLATAVARFDELRARDILAGEPEPGPVPPVPPGPPGSADEDLPAPALLASQQALELLALGEVVARKAAYGRQLTVRSAREAGASWSQIGAALGISKQSAWEGHNRWIDQQVSEHNRIDYTGLDEQEAAAARELAGPADEGPPH